MTEEKKVTLYNKLSSIGNKIPLNDWIGGQFSSYEPEEDYYIEDEGIIRTIKRKVIEPYESNPVVSDVMNGQSTILERIEPIENKAATVQERYGQIKWIKRFDPEKEIFGENENLIAEQLEDILNIKGTYEKSFIVSERFYKIVDKIFGINTEEKFGNLRPAVFSLRNGLPVALATVYFAETNPNFFIQPGENYSIIGDIMIGVLGEVVGIGASLTSTFPFIHEKADKIGRETENLKKQAQFLDKTITGLYK